MMENNSRPSKPMMCRIRHDWHIESAPATGPLFRICHRCGEYEDAVPETYTVQSFQFKKIIPGTVTYQVLKERMKFLHLINNSI